MTTNTTRRSQRCLSSLTLLLLILADSVDSQEEGSQECLENSAAQLQQQRSPPQDLKCSLFIAPSTIPNAGLGIFTAQPLEKGDTIGHGDLMIPIVDADLYHRNLGLYWMIDDYTWDGGATGMWRESDRDDGVSAFGPGLDAAINCNLALINVARKQPEWDEAGLHRSRDPGAGAITQYNRAGTIAKTNIPAGAELFKSYGDDWFKTRPYEFGQLPLSKDFPKANTLLRRFYSKFMSPSNDDDNHKRPRLSDQVIHALHNLIVNFPYPSRVLNAIPQKFSDVASAATNGIESLHQPNAIRTLDELQSIGRCLDNMRPGPSTLPQAGRGAFSTRFISAGSVITGSPVFHIPTYEMLFIYDATWNDKLYDYDMNFSSVVGYQLLLNYCWGHPESTALLCPYGAVVNYINHNQSLANVKLQWAPHGQIGHNETFLKQTDVTDWETVYTTKLGMDYVALRDIEPGEELFVDYGDDWESSWNQHVHRWVQNQDRMELEDRFYQSAAQYNRKHANDLIRTVREQRNNPYPDNLETRCHPQTLWYFGGTKPTSKWMETEMQWAVGELGVLCEVVERNVDANGGGNDYVYTVRVMDYEEGPAHMARGVTRDFITFGNVPYSTDTHLPWAFRHAMTIPNDMFPENWKNLKKYYPAKQHLQL